MESEMILDPNMRALYWVLVKAIAVGTLLGLCFVASLLDDG